MGLEVCDVTVGTPNVDLTIGRNLRGRRQILSSVDEVTDENVIEVLNKALAVHELNRREIIFLKNYEKGLQPILFRTKDYNDHINNKIVVNIANQIVTFKTSEFAGEPIMYVTRGSGMRANDTSDKGEEEKESIPEKVARVNSMMLSEGKQSKDYRLAYDMFTCGIGYRLTIHDTGDDDTDYLDEAPFEIYIPKAENTFVVKRSDVTRRVLMGVTYVFKDAEEKQPEYTVYTPNVKYTIEGVDSDMKIVGREKHNFGMVTLTEYPCNPNYMGAFEPVVPLLDAYNLTLSNKLDGIEQFIQSLAVAVNCQFEENTTANDIRKAGMIVLKSIGENKADFRILSEQLDQSQTQVLVDYLYEQVLRICAMPSTTKGGTSTSDTGAAVLARDGWYQADAAARNTEDLFKKSNRYFDEIIVSILRRKGLLDINLNDFELQFVRNETANCQSKAQAFQTLMSAGFHPELAAAKSGISNDPVSDIKMSEKYLRMIWGDPDAADKAEQTGNEQEKVAAEGEATVVEQDADNGEDDIGGAV